MAGGATGRSIVASYYPFAWGTVHAPETAGIVDVESPYALPRTFIERESVGTIEAAIDRAIANGRGMVLFGHDVVDGETVDPDGFETDVARIRRLTAYVRVDDLAAETVRAREMTRRHVGVVAVGSTRQPVSPGEATTVDIDGTRFDHRGMFDPDAGDLVVSRPGTDRLAGVVHLELDAGERIALAVRLG